MATTWHCPDCGELHAAEFDTCWKCGATRSGVRDPEFSISEPVRAEDQAPSLPGADALPARLEFPTLTYYSIPVLFWIDATAGLAELLTTPTSPEATVPVEGQVDGLTLPLLVVFVVQLLLIGIPAFLTMAQAQYLLYTRGKALAYAESVRWWLAMFHPPPSLRRQHPWFVWFYYSPFVVFVIGAATIAIWRVARELWTLTS